MNGYFLYWSLMMLSILVAGSAAIVLLVFIYRALLRIEQLLKG